MTAHRSDSASKVTDIFTVPVLVFGFLSSSEQTTLQLNFPSLRHSRASYRVTYATVSLVQVFAKTICPVFLH